MEQEWFIGVTVMPKEGAKPSGWPEDEPFDEAKGTVGVGGQITGGYHNPDDPHATLVFEVHGWYWYAHDLTTEVPSWIY